jgi:hypothetical protein
MLAIKNRLPEGDKITQRNTPNRGARLAAQHLVLHCAAGSSAKSSAHLLLEREDELIQLAPRNEVLLVRPRLPARLGGRARGRTYGERLPALRVAASLDIRSDPDVAAAPVAPVLKRGSRVEVVGRATSKAGSSTPICGPCRWRLRR